MRCDGRAVLLAGALLGGIDLAAPARALEAPAPSASSRPLYYDRLVTGDDLRGRSADELRLMRNTIFARAGRTFDDPALRDHFSRQPWHRPAPGGPRKLSPRDETNLAGIKLWEKHAKALEGLRRLVPGFDPAAPIPPQQTCGTDEHRVLRDKREERQLVAEAGRLPWMDLEGYREAFQDQPGTKMKAVHVVCGPDLDGDGFAEAVVTMTRPVHVDPPDPGAPQSMDLTFLASRRGQRWRALAPLGLTGSILGIEGDQGTTGSFVTLADGRRGLVLRYDSGGGGDCDCDGEVISVATLEGGKLRSRGEFDVHEPCDCEFAGSE